MLAMERVSYYLSALLLVVAPLYYAGKTAGGELLIESIGLLLLCCIVWGGLYSKRLFGLAWIYLLVSMGLALLYLLPVPFELWQTLPGRSLYAETFLWLKQQGVEPDLFQLSLVPSETVLSLLMLIPTLAVFLSAVSLPDQLVKRLVYVFLLMASVQGVLGLIQYASDDLFFVFGMDYHGRMAQGMYVNRDHFAALMEMALPMALALMLYSVGRTAIDRRNGGFGSSVNRVVLFAFVALVIFLAAVFSRSRTGVLLVLLLVLLSSVVFSRHLGGKQSVGWASVFAVIAGGVAMSVGLIPVLNRFIAQDPLEDGRWPIFETTLTVIREFFPLGSGPGTYAEMYRAFQPAEQAFFANHAHNDYLELLVEMGAAGAFIIAGFLIVYFYGWLRLRKNSWNRMRFLQVAAGLSIFAILLHSLLDFNLHTPANFVVFAFLCGVFFRTGKF